MDGSTCPRCGASRLRGWKELTEEEREIAKRLPAAADYTSKEREATHRWCVRCWYEERGGATQNA